MASNGPYYQPVSDEMRLAQGILDYAANTPQPSLYPEPSPDFHQAHHHVAPDPDLQHHGQLQGLVEAATSAAAQEQIRQRFHADDHELATLLRDNARAPRRKRSVSLSDGQDRSKRQKRQPLLEDNPEDSTLLDARAAGVHSAAALFRAPSDSSKKYTRPPMSKLFTSLELSPENFLYLQAAAKQYMLDPDYPDRQACVGNRGRGDNEMVKARMYQCVREFLETEGWGEKYFGENAPPASDIDDGAPPAPRRYTWPRDRDRIIALCTPLLRRMVTNERQRQYAVETRKTGAKQEKAPSVPANPDPDADPNSNPDPISHIGPQPDQFDPRLDPGPAYHIYLIQNDTRQPLRDRISFTVDQDLDWQLVVDTLVRYWCETVQAVQPPPDIAANIFDRFAVKVLTSSGLTAVSNESEWQLASQDVRQTVWLDGVVKIVVDCPLQT